VIPTCSALWNSGGQYKQRFDAILRENYESFGGRDIVPVWFEKTWQVLWNKNDHNRDHGISPHCDYVRHIRIRTPSQASLLDVAVFSH
jgi:hypothetical protein